MSGFVRVRGEQQSVSGGSPPSVIKSAFERLVPGHIRWLAAIGVSRRHFDQHHIHGLRVVDDFLGPVTRKVVPKQQQLLLHGVTVSKMVAEEL
jgi:hypothetical protein